MLRGPGWTSPALRDEPRHFGAVSMPSTVTGLSFYGALQGLHVGHHAIWDEGGRFELDPILGNDRWTAGWDPVFDATSSLALGRACRAFSAASIDRNPGPVLLRARRPGADRRRPSPSSA